LSKKGDRIRERVSRRQKAWENSGLSGRKGFKAPGSNKKPFPKGSGR